MTKRSRLPDEAIDAFCTAHPGWHRSARGLERTFAFPAYPAAVAFAVRVAFAAEEHEHHPDMTLRWNGVEVVWTTHDAGGVTELDAKLALLTDGFAPTTVAG